MASNNELNDSIIIPQIKLPLGIDLTANYGQETLVRQINLQLFELFRQLEELRARVKELESV